jgi:YggT family protein
METEYFAQPFQFLIETLFSLYILAVLLRFLLQLVRADFYNPISQFLVKITNPPLKTFRRAIPGLGGIDLASLILAWLLQALKIFLIFLVNGQLLGLLQPLIWAIPQLIEFVLNIYLFAVIIQVILSWVNPGSYNPAIGLLYSLTAPVMRPAQKMLPPVNGLDLSPILVTIVLILLKMLLIPPLLQITGSPLQ